MAVTNTGIVLRTITGVNESDLFLDSEATSVTTNTGVVERSIVGVHDANFVRPLGDEEIVNGSFDSDTNWSGIGSNGFSISGGKLNLSDSPYAKNASQGNVTVVGKTYKVTFQISDYVKGSVRIFLGGAVTLAQSSNGVFTSYVTASANTAVGIQTLAGGGTTLSIDNVSVKEMLVNRESTTTNTGIVERPITGVNESDPMFPDNTISNIVNIAGLIGSLIADLKARATTFENEEATQEILINLQKC
jgi:hypothetical protein